MLSPLSLFSIGIGPSSSHTVGPMKAAAAFAAQLQQAGLVPRVHRIRIDLYGSLALTGTGHGTLNAVQLGMEAQQPHSVEPHQVSERTEQIRARQQLNLALHKMIGFNPDEDIVLHKAQFLPRHTNGIRFFAFAEDSSVLLRDTYYSIGGGFICREDDFDLPAADQSLPLPYRSASELLQLCEREGLTIAGLALRNEAANGGESAARARALEIAAVMQACVQAGCRNEGTLPGGLNVKRRAPQLFRKLTAQADAGAAAPLLWPLLYAMAVNEENAAGGRVVTAPTNGAAGIVPAVLQYYRNFMGGASEQGIVDFLLTAGAIGLLYKMNASISGAEVGCQGEVGVACSMAAAALTAVLGGTLAQVENAAEIAMEHHLGMTCDPIGGLVQIPCIERNGVAAEQAIKIAQLALLEDGSHQVSLDKVIATMLQTGRDMNHIYKETALGGLAVNVPEC